MLTLLPGLVIFGVLVALALFLWFWWAAPRDQVPPHLTEPELKRLEVQDRLRQTNYQILTAIGLGATFLITLFQFFAASRQWSSDYELKLNQERLGQFVQALKDIEAKSAVTALAGVRTVFSLGSQAPDSYAANANEVLSAHVRLKTREKSVMEETGECHDDFDKPYADQGKGSNGKPINGDREEALEDVQAAMSALGRSELAITRAVVKSGECTPDTAGDGLRLRLEHLHLDNLDLTGGDFSCSRFSQSRIHRTSFYSAKLENVDFRGASFADFEIPASPAANGRIKNFLYVPQYPETYVAPGQIERLIQHISKRAWIIIYGTPAQNDVDAARPKFGGLPEWQRYRCWVSDLRYSNLRGSNFEGAKLSGVDLQGADLTHVNLCRADVSRVNFKNVKGLTKKMIDQACVGQSSGDEPDLVAQPFGLPKNFGVIPRCPALKIC